MILMIDNYDSFTYNIIQYFGELGEEILVRRNDDISLEEIENIQPDYLVISPGPCTPDEAGISLEAIRHFAGKIPILGVCLGHQAIAQVFGGKVVKADRLVHGKTSPIQHDERTLFSGMPQPFRATRYHSLIVERVSLPECLEISAWTQEEEIMGLRHRELPVEGVQFHPESVMTESGKQLLQHFLQCYKKMEVI
ncbi:MAG TPA: aminodeoxychorismate/anthranilate synthase component II [Bacillaceae bacterium]